MSNAVRQKNSAQETVSFPVKTPVARVKAIASDSPPTHPHMAPFGSNVHNDAYMSDTYDIAGPIGGDLLVTQGNVGGFPITLTFDSLGRIITVVMKPETGERTLLVVDPVSLDVLARQPVTAGEPDFSIGGGIYFVLDNEHQAIVPTLERKIQFFQISQTTPPAISKGRCYDLSGVILDGDQIVSAVPDWAGNLWYVTGNGLVGLIDPTKQDPDIANNTYRLIDGETGEPEMIANSFAVDADGGVFIVSDHALYRFGASEKEGKPEMIWRVTYDRGTQMKPGQKSQGSGTTPTLLDIGDEKFVAIADNADRMNVLVFRRASYIHDGQERLAWQRAVFQANNGATENSLIGTGRFIIVENNYGYDGRATAGTGTTSRGIELLALDPNGKTRRLWVSPLDVPSVVSKLSLANGLVYTYVKRKIGWHFAAVYFETGRLAFDAFTGLTSRENDHYAGLCLGPDGTAYIGVLEGIVAVRQQPIIR